MKKLMMLSVLGMCFAAPAMAEMPKDKAMMDKKADMWFSKIDTNSDGMISMEEHTKFSDDMFKKADANTDGNISKEEMKAAKVKEHAEMKKEMPEKKM